jgi:carboxylesterase type B
MEKEGTPNAGLWDQRAVLEWIRDYGSLFGGDAKNVSVWGESAGAGSIMHHLTAFGGTRGPLFKRAIIQSPAFDVRYNRGGSLEKQFQAFASAAGCAGKGVACLRKVDFKAIKTATDKVVEDFTTGGFTFW